MTDLLKVFELSLFTSTVPCYALQFLSVSDLHCYWPLVLGTCAVVLFAMTIQVTEKPVQHPGEACRCPLIYNIDSFSAQNVQGVLAQAIPSSPSFDQTLTAQMQPQLHLMDRHMEFFYNSSNPNADARQRLEGIVGSNKKGCQHLERLSKAAKTSQLQTEMHTDKQVEELSLELHNWLLPGCNQRSGRQFSHFGRTCPHIGTMLKLFSIVTCQELVCMVYIARHTAVVSVFLTSLAQSELAFGRDK